MRLVRILGVVALIGLAAVGGWAAGSGRLDPLLETIGLRALVPTPHERYAARLRAAGLADTAIGRQWLAAADSSLLDPRRVRPPRSEAVDVAPAAPLAVAYRAALRRGQETIVTVTAGTDAARVFVDLFEDQEGTLTPVAHAGDDGSISHEIRRDAEYVVRIQPELGVEARLGIEWRVAPTLTLPVQGGARRSIQSYFRAPRDGGRREHQGVDIFAPRGTPVLAATDGIVTSVGTNRLGGNVVWVLRPMRRESMYYAHLDTQETSVGRRVKAGDVLGTVGSTGNAAGGPAHLHFGIYTPQGAVDPLPYLDPAPREDS